MKLSIRIVLSTIITLLLLSSCEVKHSIKIKNELNETIDVGISGKQFDNISSGETTDYQVFKNNSRIKGLKFFKIVAKINNKIIYDGVLRLEGKFILSDKNIITFYKDSKGKVIVEAKVINITDDAVDKLTSKSIEDFDSFYDKFVDQKDFQISRVKFPITGNYYDGMLEINEWTKENWIFITKKLDLNSQNTCTNCKVEDKKTESLVIQKIWIENSGFCFEYRFKIVDKKWFLVHRQVLND